MPKFDGTGPTGQGPMSGRGEGYCALVLPENEGRDAVRGYAGVQGTPVQWSVQEAALCRPRRAFGRGRRRRGRRR